MIVKFKAEHMIEILETGIVECGISVAKNSYIERIAKEREEEGKAWTYLDDGVVACAGIDELWDGVAEVWAMFTKGVQDRPSILKAIKLKLESLDYNRIQCHVRSDFYASLRLIQFLGFKEECLCEKYTLDGADCYQFSKVK